MYLRAALCLALGIAACRSTRSARSPETEGAPAPEAEAAATPEVSPEEAAAAAPKIRPPGAIFQSELARATGRGPAWLLRQLAPEPAREQGRFVGWRIGARFPGDPGLCGLDCDLQVGDVIQSVNGNRLERPEQLTQLLASLPAASQLAVARRRAGVAETKIYTFADG
jgi:type II secretory pathway component PulC